MTAEPQALRNFLGDDQSSPEERARFVVLPVPYEMTTTYMKGCDEGPRAIIDASWNVECYDEEAGLEFYRAGLFTAPPFTDLPAPKDLAPMLQKRVERFAAAGKFAAVLGGEHSVSLGPILAYLRQYPDLSVLHIDAHADMREAYDGTPFSHASVMRRVQESCKVVQVGIRSISVEEAEALPGLNCATFLRRDCRRFTPEHIDRIVSELTGSVYFSCDIDGFDPAYAPATGTPEPGGLDWGEFSDLVREVASRRRIVGMDVVEVKPNPGEVRTEFLAARVVCRTMAWVARTQGGKV